MVANAKRAEAEKAGKVIPGRGENGPIPADAATAKAKVNDAASPVPLDLAVVQSANGGVTFQPAEAQQTEMVAWARENEWRKSTVSLLFVAVLLSVLFEGMNDKLAS